MAILAAVLPFCHLVAGFRNGDLVTLVSSLLERPYTARQATYDLRRLRRKGLIVRRAMTEPMQEHRRRLVVPVFFAPDTANLQAGPQAAIRDGTLGRTPVVGCGELVDRRIKREHDRVVLNSTYTEAEARRRQSEQE